MGMGDGGKGDGNGGWGKRNRGWGQGMGMGYGGWERSSSYIFVPDGQHERFAGFEQPDCFSVVQVD